jgi:hypothetical protein
VNPLTNKIHLVCKQAAGLRIVDKQAFIFESEGWLLSVAEMAAFKGGEALLHETKARPSYFGGTVLDVRPVAGGDDESDHVRCVLTIQSTAAGKGVKWDKQGQRNAIARTDGVVATPA